MNKIKAQVALACYVPQFISAFKNTLKKESQESNFGWVSFNTLFKKVDLMGMDYLNRRARKETVRTILRLLLESEEVEMKKLVSQTYWRINSIKY